MGTPVLTNVVGLEISLTQIADLIREKGNTIDPLEFPQGFVGAIGALGPLYYSGTVNLHFTQAGSATISNLYNPTDPSQPLSLLVVATASQTFPCDISENISVFYGAVVNVAPSDTVTSVVEDTSGTQTNTIIDTSESAGVDIAIYADTFVASVTVS